MSEASPPLEMVRKPLGETAAFDNPFPVLGTADALVSTGDLNLIEDVAARFEIMGYLARSRDYWLVPLYQYEQSHKDACIRFLMHARESGISPLNLAGPARRAPEPDVAGFLANPNACTIALVLVATQGHHAGLPGCRSH